MTNQSVQETNSTPNLALNPKRVALIRVINSVIIVAITLTLPFSPSNPNIEICSIIISTAVGILLITTLGYMLIRREKIQLGLDLIIYSFIFGLFLISFFVEGLGLFTFVTLVLLTPLSASTSASTRRVSIAVIFSILFGGLALLLDINIGATQYRIPQPPLIQPVILGITFLMVLAFAYYIYRQFPTFTLRIKLITSFIIVTLTAIIAFVLIANFVVRDLLIEIANESLLSAASQAEDNIEDFISNTLANTRVESQLPAIVDYLALSPEERELDTLGEAKIIRTAAFLALKNQPYITSYAILDTEGNVLIDTQFSDMGTNKSDREYFTSVMENEEAYVSPIIISPTTNEPSIYFSAPVRNYSGAQIIGVIRVRYNADVIQDILASSNDIVGEGSYGVLLDENHIILAHGAEPNMAFKTVIPLEDDKFEQLINEGRIPDLSASVLFGNLNEFENNITNTEMAERGYTFFESIDIFEGLVSNQVVAIEMGDPPWILTFFQPTEIFLQPLDRLINITLIISIFIIPAIIGIAIGVTQFLTRPISKLTETVKGISQGDLGIRVEIDTEDEIGELANSFNNMTAQLQNLVTNLEGQVFERTRDLESSVSMIKAAAEVARDATSEVSLDDLLDRAVTLIADRFSFYHVGIYMIEEDNQAAVIVAGSDAPGQQLTNDKHKYLINSDSNLGRVCLGGEAKIFSAEDPSSQISFHPLLPSTQAQLIIPLKAGDRIWGAVDIHSTNPKAFSEDDITIFHTMTDQIAIAIEKAEIHEGIQNTLEELEAAYRIFTKESWDEFIASRDIGEGYRYRNLSYEKITEPSPEVTKAWINAEKIISNRTDKSEGDTNTSTIAVPMVVRGEVIGVLNLNLNTDQVPMETNELIEEISNRLSLILENARLVERAQSRVEQEQLTNYITNQIRQTLDMDTVLRSAVKEFGENLGLAEVEIRLGEFDGSSQEQSNGSGDNEVPEIQPDTSELEE